MPPAAARARRPGQSTAAFLDNPSQAEALRARPPLRSGLPGSTVRALMPGRAAGLPGRRAVRVRRAAGGTRWIT